LVTAEDPKRSAFILPEELSTVIIFLKLGAALVSRSWVMRGRLLRGAARGRLVSRETTRWEASRCVRAEMTWVMLKEGLRGT
jgi:hypothetical protein